MNLPDTSSFEPAWKTWLDKWFIWLLAAGILVNASGLLLPVLEPDGTLYALISKTMAQTGDYIRLMLEGEDWLDKPHFHFWVTALSYKLFGVNSFAYKFPAFLFWLAGAYYTYALASKLHNRQTGRLAVLIYMAAEHLIISNNDVRAEPYLTGLIIASVYYYYRGSITGKLKYFILASLWLACAVMTKGIFVAVIVFAGFAVDWIMRKKWAEFVNYRWWLSAVLVLLFIFPELVTLYLQFDRHPEKTVFGKTGVSGIRFFFWDSQFGRFTNTGPIKGKGDPFFYVHTMLWAFLPWSLMLVMLVISKFRKAVNGPSTAEMNWVCPGIFLTGFFLFSLSSFQLPHYLNILYPFLSIILAGFMMNRQAERFYKAITLTQNIVAGLLFLLCIGLTILLGLRFSWIIAVSITALAGLVYRIFPVRSVQDAVGRSFAAMLIANLFLNLLVYPVLFSYQSGNAAAAYLRANPVKQPVYLLKESYARYAFQFYSPETVKTISTDSLYRSPGEKIVFAPERMISLLKEKGIRAEEISRFKHYPISRLTLKFINRDTREQEIEYFVLLKVSR
jgi:4-amino-4-deoxy-L-arabinose transferase-like glycosyltransferase